MIEDIGYRLVIENLSGFLSGMQQVNGTVADTGSNLGSLASVYETANRKQSAFAEIASANLRPAMAAVRSLFYTTTSAMVFFAVSQDKMSSGMRTAMKVVSGFTLAMTAAISLYRVWHDRALIAAAAQAIFTAATGVSTVGVVAFGAACAAVFWPLTLLAAILGAVAVVVYTLWNHWRDLLEIFNQTPPALKELLGLVNESKSRYDNLTLTLETLNKEHEKLTDQLQGAQAEYNHARDTALGYKAAIGTLEGQLETSKEKFDELKQSIADAHSELNMLTRPRFKGQQEVEDQLFSMETGIKRMRLEQLQGADNQWAIDQMQSQYDILLLQSQIKYDPLTRQAQEAVEEIEGLNEEMAPEEVMTRIRELGAQILADTDAMTTYQNNITSITTNLNAINTEVDATLDTMQNNIDQISEKMYLLEQNIRGVKTAADEANIAYEQYKSEYEQAKPSAWQQFWGGLSGIVNEGTAGISSTLQMWRGGLVKAAQGVLVGERGPEVLSLPAGSMVHPNTYNTSYNITANYSNPQQPQGIAMDLEYIRMRSRV